MNAAQTPLPAWLLAATTLAYVNALGASFQFDDYKVIVDNPAAQSMAAWWTTMPGIRPLLKLSYALNASLSTDAVGFHVVNLCLHLVNVALVWRLTAFLPTPDHWPALPRARLIATLLFALHPIQTEAVTYVSGRSMSLMSGFALAALLCWLEAARQTHPRRWRWAGLGLIAAAILSKEVAVVTPLLLWLWPKRQGLRPGPWTLMVLGLAGIGLLAWLGYARLLTEPLPRSLGTNLLSELHALYYLLGQLLQPLALNIDPDLPELTRWSTRSGFELAGLLGALAIAWHQRIARPWLGFGLGWLLLLLLPTHSLIPRLDLASERHLYLAAFGLYWLTGLGLASLPSLQPTPRWLAVVALLSLAGLLLTALRNADYRDEISLWQSTVQRSPDKTRAWNNLGYAQALAGRGEAAAASFRQALRLDPQHPRAGHNLDALLAGRLGPNQQIHTRSTP